MNRVLDTLKQVFVPLFHPEEAQRAADEAYLAGSVDVCDLEHRLDELDRRASRGSALSSAYFQQH